MVETTDNCSKTIDETLVKKLNCISNQKICDLISEDNPNLLIFPDSLNQSKDTISDSTIFTIQGNTLRTYNIMGFIGVNGCDITIQSRFAKNGEDYFLHYMLQKVFSINMFNLEHGINRKSVFDFLLYIFPFYFKKALRQGIYKEYRKQEYNDSNIKGSINFNKHIRYNIPFVGRIAYRVREHSPENNITHLIRHTIEFIRKHKNAHGILNSDSEMQNYVNNIVQVTPSYDFRERTKVISKNLKPFSHPYFFEYRDLKEICIQILKFEELKYGNEKDKIYGILFDGAWLWEEYLNTILKDCGFKHPQNKISKGGIYLFIDPPKYKRYPDFWKENFVIDAKYKRKPSENEKIDRNDMNQIISYMYVKQIHIGGFLFPAQETTSECVGKLNGYGGQIHKLSLAIPQNVENLNDFYSQMKNNEEELKSKIHEKKSDCN